MLELQILDAGELDAGREQVLEACDVVAHRARGDVTLPPRDRRHADAAVVQRALDAAQWAVAVLELGVVTSLAMRSVVGREQDQRSLAEPQFVDAVDQPADVGIETVDARGETTFRGGPVGPLRELSDVRQVHTALAGLVVRVGDRRCEVEEERPLPVPLDESERLFEEQVLAPDLLFGREAGSELAFVRHDVRERHPLFLADQIGREVVVRVCLVEVAEELVEALVVRDPGRVLVAEAPLADEGRRVARVVEDLRDGDVTGLERDAEVPTDARATRVPAGHQHAPRRRAHGRPRVELREAHALGGHLVESRRRHLR